MGGMWQGLGWPRSLHRESWVKAAKPKDLTSETEKVLQEKGEAEQEGARVGLLLHRFPATLQLIPALQDPNAALCSAPLLRYGFASPENEQGLPLL